MAIQISIGNNLPTGPVLAGALTMGFALTSFVAFAGAAANRDVYQIQAKRIENNPDIDGVLDEAVWQSAPVIDDFTQQEPNEGLPATERTEVRLLYGARSLFIGVHAYDSGPLVATEMRRDSDRILEEDNFELIIDTFNDSRSGYMFVTNPLGAKLEQQVAEEGEGTGRGVNSNVNRNWDGIWMAAARQTSDGWTAEIAIPMTTVRFRSLDTQVWGINFMRNIRRKNERVYWAPIPKAYELTRVSMAGTLTGMTSLNQGMDLRVKPFLLAGAAGERVESGMSTSAVSDIGLDVKYGVTSSLNLDLTVKTDFAQVEADQQQVNLTRFSLFFPEKRDFFLENAGLFNVATQRQQYLFFSRRIGLSDSGDPIPIIAGARLTGKVGRNSVGFMDIQTDDVFETPGDNFLVTRYSRDILSRSKIGGLFINKQSGSKFNRTAAVDANFALGNLTINSFLAKTSTPDVTNGDMMFWGRVGFLDPAWNLYAQYTDIQDNFNAEVGFIPRRGIRTTNFHIGPTPRPGKFNIRVIRPMINFTYTTDQTNRLVSRFVHYMVGFDMENGAFINFVYNRRFELLDVPFQIQPDVTIPVGAYSFGAWNFTFNTDPSKRIYERLTYAPQTFYDGTRNDITAAVGVRATSQLAAELEYFRNDVKLPGGDFIINLGILRLDYALSPRTTLRGLFQYNSSTNELSTNVRFNFRYTPGSDIYVAYDELRLDERTMSFVKDRRLVVKLNYLFAR
jgi:hypothetical protein